MIRKNHQAIIAREYRAICAAMVHLSLRFRTEAGKVEVLWHPTLSIYQNAPTALSGDSCNIWTAFLEYPVKPSDSIRTDIPEIVF